MTRRYNDRRNRKVMVLIERRHAHTIALDLEIIRLLRKGHDPKQIRKELKLVNVWAVYNAIRRNKAILFTS